MGVQGATAFGVSVESARSRYADDSPALKKRSSVGLADQPEGWCEPGAYMAWDRMTVDEAQLHADVLTASFGASSGTTTQARAAMTM